MRGQLTARALALIRSAAPANFGMVMATGIVSIALHLLGMEAGALALFYVNIGMFCCLWAVYIPGTSSAIWPITRAAPAT